MMSAFTWWVSTMLSLFCATAVVAASITPMQRAFSVGQSVQAWALDSLISMVTAEVLPPFRPAPPTMDIMFIPPHFNLAGSCNDVSVSAAGPTFIANAFEHLAAVANSSGWALRDSIITVADVLGGPSAAPPFQTLHDNITGDATGMNVVVARWAITLSCLNGTGYASTLLALRGNGYYRQGLQEGQGLFNATHPVRAGGSMGVASPFWGVPLQAAGTCKGAALTCFPSVPSAPSLNDTIATVAPLIQAAAASCDTLQLCASLFGFGLVNVGPCHDSASYTANLQTIAPRVGPACVHF